MTDDMRAALRNDSTFMEIMTGGVLDQPLTATGPMWVADPVTGIKTLRPTAVLLETQEVPAPFGLNPGQRMDIWQEPELFFYADNNDVAIFDIADARAMALLHRTRVGLADIEATPYRARPLVADELPGTIWHIFRRYRVTTVRHIQEV